MFKNLIPRSIFSPVRIVSSFRARAIQPYIMGAQMRSFSSCSSSQKSFDSFKESIEKDKLIKKENPEYEIPREGFGVLDTILFTFVGGIIIGCFFLWRAFAGFSKGVGEIVVAYFEAKN